MRATPLLLSGEHVAHAALVRAYPETLEAVVDVSYLLAWGRPQPPQGDIGESYNAAPYQPQSRKSREKWRDTMSNYGQAKAKKVKVL